MGRIVWVALLCAGCCFGSEVHERVYGEAVAPAPAPAPAAPAPTEILQELHEVAFVDGEAFVCSDSFRQWTIPAGVAWTPPTFEPLERSPEEGIEFIRIPQTCTQQFPGRPIFATCGQQSTVGADAISTIEVPEGTTLLQVHDSHYLGFGGVRTDTFMTACLREGGTWEAMDESSPEYQRAELEDRLERLERGGRK